VSVDPRIAAFLADLAPYSSADEVGKPFGSEPELEEVIAMIMRHLSGIEEVRRWDRMLMVELLVAVPGDDPQQVLLDVMGIPDWSRSPNDKAKGLAGAALELIRQSRDPGNLWDLWEQREDIALEVFAWHCVARQRLTTAGKVPSIGSELL
jgi:hypothetical protein